MKDKIANTKFNNPLFKIVNNVTAKPEIKSENIKELLVETNFFYSKMERQYH